MKLEMERPSRESPAAEAVLTFLRLLLIGRLDAAAQYATSDMVFLGRHRWRGEATPFRDDARYQEGSLRQLPPEEVTAIPPDKQRTAFEVTVGPNEYVFFAIVRTSTSRATLGIIARDTGDGYAIARLFDTKHVRGTLLPPS